MSDVSSIEDVLRMGRDSGLYTFFQSAVHPPRNPQKPNGMSASCFSDSDKGASWDFDGFGFWKSEQLSESRVTTSNKRAWPHQHLINELKRDGSLRKKY
jgi:hypothetical protein